MEANFGGESYRFYGEASDLGRIRKKGFEWDLNDWNWNGELFIATPVNSVPLECRNKQLFPVEVNGFPSNSSSSCSEETDFGIVGKGKGEAEKRRRIVVVEEDEPYDGAASLSLNLAEHVSPVVEGELANGEETNGKKSKSQGGNSNRPICQVKDCRVDLSSCKDYHRRHKVCQMHAKANTAVVGNAVQRFCQQCSRFHLLEEFDEGKRSCRRRLAGHNKRRRKTHPPTTTVGSDLIDDKTSSYLLINLLRILCSLHSDNSEPPKDQDLLSHFLSNLANLSGSFDARNISALLQTSQTLQKLGGTAGTSSEAANALLTNSPPAQESSRLLFSTSKVSSANGEQATVHTKHMHSRTNLLTTTPEPTAYRARLKDFDLNNTYSDTECGEGCEESATLAYTATGSHNCPSWMLQDTRQSSPPQISGNSDSASGRSLSSSNGDAQCRTDRIVFKLFGKDPHDLPLVLRAQILDWLSNSPTDIESYMRPGCIILTIYLRLAESAWEDLCSDLSSYLGRLLHITADEFWKSGWIYARVQHQIGFIYNGQVLLDTYLPLIFPDQSKIVCIRPIAVPPSTTVNFTVKGFNIARPAMRLLCSFEGKYLVQESTQAIVRDTCMGTKQEGSECLSFSCSLPDVRGRGFVEVEDNGLSNGFFPFIVAEQDVCSEIRMLENAIDIATHDESHGRADIENVRNQALQFLNELGWLLRRNSLGCSFEKTEPCLEVFHLRRFQWLIAFAMEQNWCAVIKKLLDILFSGAVDLGGKSPPEVALSENLLHTAVRRNCKSMVEFLLNYTPLRSSKESSTERFLFRPDSLGPSNITPLHIAASSSGAESVLDVLINDPDMVGIKAWKSARDTTGFTPEDYARTQGHESYLLLVQKKIDGQLEKDHVLISIPGDVYRKDANGAIIPNNASLEISKLRPTANSYCNLCSRQLARRSSGARTLLYKPAMLSMVGIAAVCVCVGLLFKTPPEVFFVFPSFRWEHLLYGSM